MEITVQMCEVTGQGSDGVIGGGKRALAYRAVRGAGGVGVAAEQAEGDQAGALFGGLGGEVGVLRELALEIGDLHSGLAMKGAELVAAGDEGGERVLAAVVLGRRLGVAQGLTQSIQYFVG
ncbi:hypothetical protein AB6O49_00030 [Streptomyces sp. SBR177]